MKEKGIYMKKIIKKSLNNSFVRSVLVMASGTAAAQAITMGLSPIITRMYGPEAFGIMGTFTAMINIIIPVAALTYPIAIVLPKSDEDAKGIVRLSLIIAGVISFISLIILFLLNDQIINLFNLHEIASYLYLIPLVVIFAGLVQVAEQWLIRTKQFSINAQVTFYQSLIINGSKVGIGLTHPVAGVLVVMTALGNGIRALMMIMFIKKSSNQTGMNEGSKKKSLKRLALEYYDFPTYRSPQVFINAISQSLPVLILTSFFGVASAGLYTIGRTVLSIPTQLIGKSVGDVFYPRISEAARNKENVTAIIKKATLVLGLIGIIPFGIIILFGPIIFSVVFGDDWYMAGEYARWTALWIYFLFMNQPSVRALPVLSAQKFHLKFTIITVTARILALSVGYFIFNNDLIAIALFSITGAILNALLIYITLQISNKIKNQGVV